MNERERYESEVLEMVRQVQLWRAGHPGAVLQFQQPLEARFAVSLAAALDAGLASTNKDCWQMFIDLDWLHDAKPAPTPFQVQIALELSCKEPTL